MLVLLFLTLGLRPAEPVDVFEVQFELQAMYDEISQATLQFVNETDIDQFHDVVYTPDWTITDAAGHAQTWPQAREQAVRALGAPKPDSMIQRIQKLSLVPGGATVVVEETTIHTFVDDEAKYGRKGATHTRTVTTDYRDTWANAADHWKLKSRQQIAQSKIAIDKPVPDTEALP